MTELKPRELIDLSGHDLMEQVKARFEELSYILENKNGNTKKAYLNDFDLFRRFCEKMILPVLSENMETSKKVIKCYVDDLVDIQNLKKATIKRKLSAISYFIDAAEMANPIRNSRLFKEYLSGKLRKGARAIQSQATPMKMQKIEEFNSVVENDSTIIALRDAAIINFAFDTLLRASNIIDIQVSDVFGHDGRVLVRWSKNDQDGNGSYRYLSDISIELCKRWVKAAGIKDGYLFRRVSKGGKASNEGLSYNGLLYIFKRIGSKVGLKLSCHSCRVGAAISMLEAGVHDHEIMRAGDWKSLQMVLRYTEKARLAKGGMQALR
ncbi:tyrosine-type recombinase/integrase [Rheinheimera sp.]|uniref:tyrosine-type recombinase/integrase n=1 Tax=Rheinheimera sp. TaxID=1869214 RepID=UPI0040488F03